MRERPHVHVPFNTSQYQGAKSREIPVRHDLQEYIDAYIDAAGLRNAPKDTPLFQRAMKISGASREGRSTATISTA
jgi:hypothetical protein